MEPTAVEPTTRCWWCGTDPLYVAYHDEEWGVPEHDPRALWEKLVLDGFQAGLSWITILRKREAFREVFQGFDPEKVAAWGEPQIEAALADARIVRHRGKIEAAVTGARAFLRIEEGPGLHDLLWDIVDGRPVRTTAVVPQDVPTQTAQSRTMAKTLRANGFTFCGPVICYAFMQAVGMVNDHLVDCFRQAQVALPQARAEERGPEATERQP